ncbi:efflux RND transporter permease subunit [Candidatus Nucleicultrix amoebiphila]|jgi:Cu(I)/Ag(I) efflux system membrane protein CusA/SilA|uniref:Cation transporter n=1 Tax=Candidatus Nucleicultrix amoebiphila FS5 TaxID=1414854 RepID=A0A1W6N2D9_9PROT|nr:CusA/CzcA family heavy metal efflux RND transporter [Candidatus Nucleicultrix amoebiphila]ARN84034.1 cation transporter [Candidatus Nucleicultrix amoebiphila FS5]
MIEKVITWCGRNASITIIITVLLSLWGGYCLKNIRVDAIPDLSETQVIIFTEWMGRAPDLIEKQITYPLVTAMVSAPKVSVVRGFSMFGMSFVYVIFKDGTDLYWARSRVIEYLSKLAGQLPQGVTPSIGPDATGVGWVFQYALVDPTGKYNLAEIKTFQDWYLKYWLSSVSGVAEVTSIGGFKKQYQVEIDPNRLAALNIPIEKVINAIRNSNSDVGGRTLEVSEREYYVRGLGYVKDPVDIENISIGVGPNNTPIKIANIGKVSLGPNIRRGLADVNGQGDTVVGLVVLRQGEDIARVIDSVKKKIEEVKEAFPPGLELKILYDRSPLIKEAVNTLRDTLIEEILLVCLVILIFLFHLRSIVVVAITLPLSVLISMIPMYYLDISLNIMSLGGIILAVGDIVDGVVVFIENTHKKIAESHNKRPTQELAIEACRELGPSIFSALLIIGVSFLPIFALQAQEGKLFHPLAYTKTFAMIAAALVTITVTPPLIAYFVKGRIRGELENPVNRYLQGLYKPILQWCLKHTAIVLSGTGILVALSLTAFLRLGSEFMPPLWEGDLLYMPITVPGISINAASDLLTRQGAAIKAIPEVETVFGKAGRFETATDPAPISMFEYSIHLKPRDQWRKGLDEDSLIKALDKAVEVPGLNRAWTKPVRGRIDMLSTGIRTQVGVKIFGKDLKVIEEIGQQLERTLKDVIGTRSVYAERIVGGSYLDFEPDRKKLQRYGLNVGDALMVVETSVGGMEISQTIEGRERYSINVRYPRELRDSIDKLSRILVATSTGAQVPLGELGKFTVHMGPPMVLDENGSLAGYVYIDLKDRDPGGYVNDAKEAVRKNVKLPPGYFISWTGQYEYLERMQNRMKVILPLTLLLIFGFLYISMKSVSKVIMIMASVPLSLVGGILLMWSLNYNTSVAVWAGAIALIGVAVETTSIMVIFLNEAWKSRSIEGKLKTPNEFTDATIQGAQKSLRPVMMAVSMNIFGLVPVMIATGIGADVMKRLSSPMFGGLISLLILTLIVIPVIYKMYEERILLRRRNPR